MTVDKQIPTPLVDRDTSIGHSYDLLEYAIKTNNREYFFPSMLRDSNKHLFEFGEEQRQQEREWNLEIDCKRILNNRIGVLRETFAPENPAQQDLRFMQAKTVELYQAFYRTHVNIKTIFANEEEMNKYLSLMNKYLYENFERYILPPIQSNQIVNQTKQGVDELLDEKK